MNKSYTIAKAMVVSALILCAATISATTTEDILSQRVENMHSIVDMRYTTEVSLYIDQYTEKYPRTSQVLLGQATVYFPILENIIREKQMPEQLKYLAVIESGLRPNAKSRVGATGMWQFMRSTGNMYGLAVTSTIDERKDVIKATYAAMAYLKDLHEQFGDWTLALAAYNCGPGNVRKAMRRAGASDYWSIQRYLPGETRRYVPKFIAMQYLMSYYHMHDIYPEMPDQELRYLATAKVYDKVTFSELSKRLDIDETVIQSLNPMYKRMYIPASIDGNHHLTLPEDALFSYLSTAGTFDDIVYRRKADTQTAKQPSTRTSVTYEPLATVAAPLLDSRVAIVAPATKTKTKAATRAGYMAQYRQWSMQQQAID